MQIPYLCKEEDGKCALYPVLFYTRVLRLTVFSAAAERALKRLHRVPELAHGGRGVGPQRRELPADLCKSKVESERTGLRRIHERQASRP